MTTQPDPRPLFSRSLDQIGRQVAAVRPDELGNRTPCTDYDVRALLGHVVSVLRRLALAGAGTDFSEVPGVVVGIDDDGWSDAFARARDEVERVWGDDEVLDRAVDLKWATMPGRTVLDAYTHEFTIHSWDLAHATGRLADLDPDLATRALEVLPTFAPPETRSAEGTFAPVVQVPEDADTYTRLAAYTGRHP
ncbi:TIGR03086 family metal-binding protein [Saccharopolyspora indica]|uniref:TIGR03086 family metal-binding protein n=1 Tax=Saccharopolyspora indica TaxID=1229659 RepID=UPI0022EB6D75|nr:TIGR03086 family metal-binding protein [Saccharopolyspora indica]MDA3647454.1 TIGR03086 family metal-binding protein [Saccharopolyspora indica]